VKRDRPKNWEEVAKVASKIESKNITGVTIYEEGSPPKIVMFRQLVEAGATALLKALKEQGFRLDGTPNDELVLSALKTRGTKTGWLIIIEDD